jgi:hypothetical protein
VVCPHFVERERRRRLLNALSKSPLMENRLAVVELAEALAREKTAIARL